MRTFEQQSWKPAVQALKSVPWSRQRLMSNLFQGAVLGAVVACFLPHFLNAQIVFPDGNNGQTSTIVLPGTTSIQQNSGSLVVDPATGNAVEGTNANLTFSGNANFMLYDPISLGSGNLVKAGSGTLSLNGAASSYTGTTDVQGGTLQLNGAGGGALMNRWNFNGNLADSVGGSDATIVQVGAVGFNDATLGPTAVTTVGWQRNESDYVNLGSNLVPDVNSGVTIEGWVTRNAGHVWQRVFDFGSDTNNYLFASFQDWEWWDPTQARIGFRQGGGAEDGAWLNLGGAEIFPTGAPMHMAVTLDPLSGGGTNIKMYLAQTGDADLGAPIADFNSGDNLETFVDSENNLARSFWGGDETASATYDDFRIWSGALNQGSLEALHDAGADASNAQLSALGLGAAGTGQLPAGTALNLSSATSVLDLNNTTQTLGSLTGVAGSKIQVGAQGNFSDLNVGTDNSSTTFAGDVVGNQTGFAFRKLGTGTQTLTGTLDYNGFSLVRNGGLDVAGNGAIVDGRLVVVGDGVGGDSGPSSMTLTDNASVNVITRAIGWPNGEFWVGAWGGEGELTVNDNASVSSDQKFIVALNPGSKGTVAVTGNGSIATGNELWIGEGGGADAQVTISDNAAISSESWFVVGRNGATGVLNVDGGTVSKGGGGFMILGSLGGNGTVNQTGGEVLTNQALIMGEAGGVATYNLTGGVLATPYITDWGGTSNLNLDGGLLRVTGNQGNFFNIDAVNVGDGGAIIDTNGFDITSTRALNGVGTGGLTKQGAGSLTLDGPASTYAGDTVIANGTLRSGGDDQLPIGTALRLTGPDAVFDLNDNVQRVGSLHGVAGSRMLTGDDDAFNYFEFGGDNTNASFGGDITGAAYNLYFEKVGTGTQTFTGNNSFEGFILNRGGALDVAGSGSIGHQYLRLFSTGHENTGSTTLSGTANISTLGNGEIWVGNGAGGDGVMTVQDDASLYSGGWLVVGRNTGTGVLNINDNAAIEKGPGEAFVVGSLSGTGTVNQNGGYVTNGGGVVLGENAGGLGVYNLNGGTLEAAWVGPWGGATGIVNFNGGTLKARQNDGGFLNPALTAVNVLDGGATIDSNGFDVGTSEPIVGVGTGGLTKEGAGTLSLFGPLTYTGPTTVNAGTLAIPGGNLGASPSLHVASGAILDTLGAPMTPGSPLTVSGTGTIETGGTGVNWNSNLVFSPGNSPGTLNVVGPINATDGGVYNWEVLDFEGGAGAVGGWDLISVTGDVNLGALTAGGGIINAINFNSPALPLNIDDLLLVKGRQSDAMEILRASGTLNGFDAANFTINNPLSKYGYFTVSQIDQSLYLTFTSTVPEPGTWAAFGLLLLAMAAGHRRWRRTA